MTTDEPLAQAIEEAAFNYDVVHWAARECTWQRSGEMSVLWMLIGWQYMSTIPHKNELMVTHIKDLGQIVDPRANNGELRNVNVRVGSSLKLDKSLVYSALFDLTFRADELEPDEWFRQYEEIHPFADGNGRTGSILWNWLRGSLDNPQEPPDFWNYRTPELFDSLVCQKGSR